MCVGGGGGRGGGWGGVLFVLCDGATISQFAFQFTLLKLHMFSLDPA